MSRERAQEPQLSSFTAFCSRKFSGECSILRELESRGRSGVLNRHSRGRRWWEVPRVPPFSGCFLHSATSNWHSGVAFCCFGLRVEFWCHYFYPLLARFLTRATPECQLGGRRSSCGVACVGLHHSFVRSGLLIRGGRSSCGSIFMLDLHVRSSSL